MFSGRRRDTLRRAIAAASDSEVRSLREAVAERQERVAELELELFDARASLATFERDLEIRIRPLERKLAELQRALREAVHHAELKAQWGDRLDEEGVPDVVEQFRKAWRPREPGSEPKIEAPPPGADEQALKRLFRELAKRFHPDLTTDPALKAWRQGMMAKVNQAYAAKDLSALQTLALQAEAEPAERPKTRAEILAELAAEVRRLDGIIGGLQRELDELLRSELVELQLEASIARRSGRDLIGEMVSGLKLQIAEVEAELGALQ